MSIKENLKKGAVAVAIGGSLVAGSQVNKPECDYVLVREEQEICLTTAQAEAVIDGVKGSNTGFGKSPFKDIQIDKR